MPKTSTKMTTEKKSKKESKTEMLGFKVTASEKKMIECHAEKFGMTASQYSRSSVIISMALEGNVQAMKSVFLGVRDGIKEALAEKVKNMNVELPEFA